MIRPKVLVLTFWYPLPGRPQYGVFVREHARAVAPFADVAVLHWAGPVSGGGPLWRMEEVDDPSITAGLPTYRVWHRDVGVRGLGYATFLAGVFWAVRQMSKRGLRPDLLHPHMYQLTVPATMIGSLRNIPVVATEHASAFNRKALSRAELAKARFAFRRADAVLPVSEAMRGTLEAMGMHGRFRAVPNVVDTEIFRPLAAGPVSEGPARILNVGLFDSEHRKGVPNLLEAAALLARKRRDWVIEIVGDGTEAENYRRRAKELGLNGQVSFLGSLRSKSDVADRMRGAAFLVVPSRVETFAVAAAEALACGTPVLATRCGGPEEFVGESVGAVVPPQDAPALCAGLEDMLERYRSFDRPRLAAYAAGRFSAETVGGILREIYGEALARHGR